MLTKRDFDRLREIFTTREDFNLLKEEVKEIKNDLVTFKDEILHEIVAFRQEMAIVTGYSDRIENHDQRIEKLEKIVLH